MLEFIEKVFACIFLGFISSAVISAIFTTVLSSFFRSKGIDIESHMDTFLGREFEGKDQKEFDKHLKKVMLILTIIFGICFYFLAPIIDFYNVNH